MIAQHRIAGFYSDLRFRRLKSTISVHPGALLILHTLYDFFGLGRQVEKVTPATAYALPGTGRVAAYELRVLQRG